MFMLIALFMFIVLIWAWVNFINDIKQLKNNGAEKRVYRSNYRNINFYA